MSLPTKDENPTGLHQRYIVSKMYGEDDDTAEIDPKNGEF